MSNNRNNEIEQFARIFGALSNTHRLKIFLELIHCCCQECSVEDERTYVGDLAANLEIAPSTVSHHLKELRDSGLINMTRQGQRVECYIDEEIIEKLTRFFITIPAFAGVLPSKGKKK